MASGITHILLMKNIQTQLPDDGLKMILAEGRDFLQVGAVGPDLPYASIADNDFFFSTQSDLADKFHYVRTNDVPLIAFEMLRQKSDRLSAAEKRHMFSFFAGYLSHVIADGIIHPFIRDKVGDYKGHQTEHRVLEMEHDVLFYHYLTEKSNAAIELNHSNTHDELMNLNGKMYPDLPNVIDLFSDTISEVYGVRYPSDLILGWVTGLHRMFAVAEGDHPAIYRNIGPIRDFFFSNYRDLRDRNADLLVLTTPVDRSDNFLKSPKIDYFDDVIPRFYTMYIPAVQKAYRMIFKNGDSLTDADIPPIDLDTGRPLASNTNLDLVPTLWG